MPGSDIIGTTYAHPLYDRTSPVLAGGDYITTESGTGLVHTAPGHGQEDYLTGLKAGLELLSPVDDAGRFTIEAGEMFAGMSVLGEGNVAVVEALEEKGALLLAEDYPHKYPYDWRTKKPTIFRATDQWFASVEGFRDEALEAVETVSFSFSCREEGGRVLGGVSPPPFLPLSHFSLRINPPPFPAARSNMAGGGGHHLERV